SLRPGVAACGAQIRTYRGSAGWDAHHRAAGGPLAVCRIGGGAVATAIEGRCDAGLRGVREAFAENFARHGEVGAAVAVTVGGKPVVDLWAGHADAARTHPWARDTIVNVASATKGPTAICAHHLADRGLLDLAAPVAAYWPQFAQAGKAA